MSDMRVWRSKAFTSPLAALERAREKDGYFDVVIADNRMPEMNGIDFLKEFGEIHPDAVRIVLSGHTDRAGSDARDQRGTYRFFHCQALA